MAQLRRVAVVEVSLHHQILPLSQPVTTTLLAGSSWTTHTLLFFSFECGDNLCIFVFLYFLLSSARARTSGRCSFPFAFHLCFLSLILMRTGRGDEPRKHPLEVTDPTLRCHITIETGGSGSS